MTEIGIPVDPSPAQRPQHVVLAGRVVTLRPFARSSQAAALYEATHGPEQDSLWRYMGDGPFASFADYEAAFEKKEKSVDPFFFAIVDNATGLAVGQASYLRIEPAHRSIEVGNIIFSPAPQRSCGATEVMYLMARHAFHDLGYRHSVVLYARFGMALAAGEFRALAGGVELRRDGTAAAFALPPESSVTFHLRGTCFVSTVA
jgi:RimJ/RimL family protein N-acetyltransferase